MFKFIPVRRQDKWPGSGSIIGLVNFALSVAWFVSVVVALPKTKFPKTIFKRTTESTGTLPSPLPTGKITINDSLWKLELVY